MGPALANEIEALNLSADKLALVGHSNGGAVVGAAASRFAADGKVVKRLTLLDSPNLYLGDVAKPLFLQYVAPTIAVAVNKSTDEVISQIEANRNTKADAMQYVKPGTASQMEAYYSDGFWGLGRVSFGFGSPIADSGSSSVFNGRVYPISPSSLAAMSNNLDVFKQNIDHNCIVQWYATDWTKEPGAPTPGQGQFFAGIDWSILRIYLKTAMRSHKSLGLSQMIASSSGFFLPFLRCLRIFGLPAPLEKTGLLSVRPAERLRAVLR
jgi:pimeloyl-ACP methyl ester carboxylesterase